MDTIIAYRLSGGPVEIMMREEGEIAVFANFDEAIEYALDNRLFNSGQAAFQIIELDEL